jgi:hypothetical protein
MAAELVALPASVGSCATYARVSERARESAV